MRMLTMLDRVILRAADDETFRKELLADPDAALASMDCALDECRRAANTLDEEPRTGDFRGGSGAEEGHAGL